MRRPRPAPLPPPLPLLLVQLMLAASETVIRRSDMIVRGRCPPSEYQRMVLEKAAATAASIALLAFPGQATPSALLAPWLDRSRANARRLRRR